MRVLVTGAGGMLGASLVKNWQDKYVVFATASRNFKRNPAIHFMEKNLSDDSYTDLLDWAEPQVIVHCAALTNVDYCEDHPDEAFKVNTESITKLLRNGNARIIFISSDAVFADGISMATEEQEANPASVYGQTKRNAERLLLDDGSKHLAVRTTIVGKNINPSRQSFTEWIVRSLRLGSELTLFEDAIFTPISIWELADELEYLMCSELKGVLHVSGTEAISKKDFGLKICHLLGLDPSLIKPGSVQRMGLNAKRSSDQTLSSAFYQSESRRQLPTADQTVARVVNAFKHED